MSHPSGIDLMASGGFLDLEELTFDGPHTCHETVQLAEEHSLVLLRLLDEIRC